MPESESQFAAVLQSGAPNPRRRGRHAPQVAAWVLLGIVCASAAFYRAASSPAETVAVIRQRRTSPPGEDAAATIEQIASQILSPANLVAALQDSISPPGQEVSLAAAESLRSRLRVEVQPGAGRQPWIISICCSQGEQEAADAQIVNRLAELYVQASETDGMANRKRSYEAARSASQNAGQSAEKLLRGVDRQIDRLAELAAASNRSASPPPERAAQPAVAPTPRNEVDEKRAELASQLAELEAQRLAMLERLLPAHPEVLALDAEIETLRARAANFRPEAPSPAAGPRIESDVASSTAMASIADESQKTWAELNSQRKQLADALARASQLAAAERLAAGRLLHNARDEFITLSPAARVQSSWPLGQRALVAVACSAGLLAGWTFGRLRQRSSEVFHEAEELESALGVPLIGVLDAR